MKTIKPSNSSTLILVDDEDYERVKLITWYKGGGKQIVGRPGYETVSLARYILNYYGPLEIDHRDKNYLNNQKENLREATQSQNTVNASKNITNTSGYKGVHWFKHRKKWHAQITISGKKIHLGFFLIKEDAARAYNEAALEHFGEFAYLNKII